MRERVKRGNNSVSDNIINDRFANFDYTPLSRGEELSFIKKSKLSYYNEASDKEKKLYLNYFFEEFPSFKGRYEQSKNKERLLKKAIEKSKEYRDSFLKNNSRLVFFIVNKFSSNDDVADLFQEGMIGMMRALKKYDVESNNRFSTYAIWWIRQSILRYINSDNMVKIPERVNEKAYMLGKIREGFEKSFARKLSDEELMVEMGVDERDFKLIKLAEYYTVFFSLDAPVADGTDRTFADYISDETDFAEEVDDALSIDILKEEYEKEITNGVENVILSMHYGLNGKDAHSLSEISEELNLPKIGRAHV